MVQKTLPLVNQYFLRPSAYLSAGLFLGTSTYLYELPALGQPIIAAPDGTGTIVTPDGERFDIQGGSLSADGANLFHSLEKFGLSAHQIANFLANPQLRNILTRIVGGEPSLVDGLIQVTGGTPNLFLMNPAGFIFGSNATINVPASFTVTTATGIGFEGGWFNGFGENDYGILTGDPAQFAFDLARSGNIINAGELTVTKGQNLTLLAGAIVNTGKLQAESGNIAVAAIPGTNQVRISQNEGILSLIVEPPRDLQGEVLPFAPMDLPTLLTQGAAGLETGLGVMSGEVRIEETVIPTESGTAIVSGELETSGAIGGNADVLGEIVGLIGAEIDVSGTHGGGNARIGGGYKGGEDIPNAAVTIIDRESAIRADGELFGDGGEVIVWSDETTRVYGEISARGGEVAGDGGFIETSSAGFLDIQNSPDISAPMGDGGTWLIDPYDINIIDTSTNSQIPDTHPFIANGNNAVLGVDFITTALANGNVLISSGSGAIGNPGSITLSTDLNFNVIDGIRNNTLHLQSPIGSINIASNITISNMSSTPDVDTIDLILEGANIDVSGNINTDGGDIAFRNNTDNTINNLTTNIRGTINMGGGNLTFTSNADDTINVATTIGGFINTGSGNFELTSDAVNDVVIESSIRTLGGDLNINSGGKVTIGNASVIDTNTGDINISGTTFRPDESGVSIEESLNSGGGNITLTGINNSPILPVARPNGSGLYISAKLDSQATGSIEVGNIRVTGLSMMGDGVYLQGNRTVNSGGGNITINGTSYADPDNYSGVYIDERWEFMSDGGKISINGEGTNGRITISDDFNGFFNAGSENVELTADEIDIDNPVSLEGSGDLVLTTNRIDIDASDSLQGNGNLILQPTQASDNVTVGSNREFLNTDAIAALDADFNAIIIGREDGTGTITVDSDVTFNNNLILRSSGSRGAIAINGQLQTSEKSVILNAGSDVRINAGINTSGGAINIQSTDLGGEIEINGQLQTNGNRITLNAEDTISINTDIDTSENDIKIESKILNLNTSGSIGTSDRPLNTSINQLNTGSLSGNLSLANEADLTINTLDIGGNLDVTADGSIIDNGSVRVTGNSSFTTTQDNADIVLDELETIGTSSTISLKTMGTSSDATISSANLNLAESDISGNLSATATTGDLNINDTLTAGGNLSATATMGDINANATLTAGGNIKLSAANKIATQDLTTNNATITLSGTNIDTSGGELVTNGGAIAIAAAENVTTGNIDTRSLDSIGGNVNLNGTNIDTRGGELETNGGAIAIEAAENVTTGNIDTHSLDSIGGNVNLTATNGEVIAGDIDTSGTTGGNLTINALTAITAEKLTTKGTQRNGGDVTLDPIEDIQVTYIDARGGPESKGGNVDITAGRYFRATGIIDGTDASISTAGGTGGGSITIRHGGGDTATPFIVGDAAINGTTGGITTGDESLERQPYPGSYRQGNIEIQTRDRDSIPVLLPEDDPTTGLPREIVSSQNAEQLIAEIEARFTETINNRLGNANDTAIKSFSQIQRELQQINEAAGVKPAIIYVYFPPRTDILQSNTNSPDDWYGPLQLLLVTGQGSVVRRFVPEATRKEVLDQANYFKEVLLDRTFVYEGDELYLPTAQILYEWFVKPLEPDLEQRQINNLVFVMDEDLLSLPLSVLHTGREFLIEKGYSLGFTPSMSLTDTRYKNIKQGNVLAMGASEFTNLNSLPGVEPELDVIEQFWESSTLLNEDFNRKTFLAERQAQSFEIVHLATHAKFVSGDYKNSYIQFGSQEQLPLSQLDRLKLNEPVVELLVLSACETALGNKEAELGLAGTARQAGVKSILGSLWPIDDARNIGLMSQFYINLKTTSTKAEALRQAQLSMLRGDVEIKDGYLLGEGLSEGIPLPPELAEIPDEVLSHPHYWSGFTLIGNPW